MFNIVDPGLANHVGHHREINLAIARQLVTLGYSVTIYAHKKYTLIDSDRKEPTIKIVPYFSVSPYAIVSAHKSDVENMIRYELAEQSFRNQMAGLNLKGTIHLSNVFSYQLLALAAIAGPEKISGCIHHHPSRFMSSGEFLWLKSASSAGHRLNHVDFFVVEESLVNEIDRLMLHGSGVKIAPFPLQFVEPEFKTRKTNCIGILGGLRAEQGREKIGQTIRLVNSLGFEVLLQDSKNEIRGAAMKGVKIVGFIDRFSDAICECDAILLNYEPNSYRFMGSGVMWEALAHAKPIIHTRGNAIASLARKYHTGISFHYADLASLKTALLHYRENREEFSDRAFEVAKKVRVDHSLERHVQCLI